MKNNVRIAAISIICSFLCYGMVHAQNVGIGTAQPLNKLHIAGNLLVNAPFKSTNTLPTPAQTQTTSNGTTIYVFDNDSTARLYDPAGPNGDYINNLVAQAIVVGSASTIGIEINLEDVQLGTFDSLIFFSNGFNSVPLFALGNGYSTPGTWLFNVQNLYIRFKSNGDGNNGRGFNLVCKQMYNVAASQTDVSGFSGLGNGLLFDIKKGALRAGLFQGVSSMGNNSTALGGNNIASGQFSVALGYLNVSSGTSSVAIGQSTVASADEAIAMGFETDATARNSTAMGFRTLASGQKSTALGYYTVAKALHSLAIGAWNDNTDNPPFSSFGNPTDRIFQIGNGDEVTRKNAMTVLRNGAVGIGILVPDAMLDVNRGPAFSTAQFKGSAYYSHFSYGAAENTYIRGGMAGSKVFINDLPGMGNVGIGNSAPTEKLDVSGNIKATGTITPSDRRFKQNINPLQNSLAKILSLNGVSYDWRTKEFPNKGFDETKQLGFIAQEVEKVFPEVVRNGSDGYKGVDYVKLIPALVEAIKAQQKQIDELKEELKQVKSK